MKMVVCCLLLLIGMVNIAAQNVSQSPVNTRGGDEQFKDVIRSAGYQLTPGSLIEALQNQDILVATSAAALLPKVSKSKQVVMALSEAVSDPRELLAVYATRSLLALGITGWKRKASARLSGMEDKVAQLQLTGLLAQAGDGSGWVFITRAIVEGRLTTLALENADYFEGKKDNNGRSINVTDELMALLDKAPVQTQPQILRKIEQLRKTSKSH
jgi:hypothetical protein